MYINMFSIQFKWIWMLSVRQLWLLRFCLLLIEVYSWMKDFPPSGSKCFALRLILLYKGNGIPGMQVDRFWESVINMVYFILLQVRILYYTRKNRNRKCKKFSLYLQKRNYPKSLSPHINLPVQGNTQWQFIHPMMDKSGHHFFAYQT